MSFSFAPRAAVAGFLVSLALMIGGPAVANAQDCVVPSPTQDQYCPSIPPPSTTIEAGSGDPGSASAGGLPFTGYDIGMAGLVALALIGAGVGLRRASSAQEDA